MGGRLTNMPGLRLIEPLGYLDFLKLNANAACVVTDSGGLQEETTALRVPCITMRENTERPVTCEVGTNQLVGHRSRRDPRRLGEGQDRRHPRPNPGSLGRPCPPSGSPISSPGRWRGHEPRQPGILDGQSRRLGQPAATAAPGPSASARAGSASGSTRGRLLRRGLPRRDRPDARRLPADGLARNWPACSACRAGAAGLSIPDEAAEVHLFDVCEAALAGNYPYFSGWDRAPPAGRRTSIATPCTAWAGRRDDTGWSSPGPARHWTISNCCGSRTG